MNLNVYNNNNADQTRQILFWWLAIVVGMTSKNIFSPVQGYLQQLYVFHPEKGYNITFSANVPDLTIYPLAGADEICVSGVWALYLEPNYEGLSNVLTHDSSEAYCYSQAPVDYYLENFKSIRFMGLNETTIDAAILFSRPSFQGQELVITESAFENIDQIFEVKSWIISGSSERGLFNGSHFDGTVKRVRPIPPRTFATLSNSATQPVRSIYRFEE